MGANTFLDTAVGTSAREAFDRLTDQARYEYGHGGYTGTIAEKHGFREFTLPEVPGLSPSSLVEFCLNGIYDEDGNDAAWTPHTGSRLVDGKWVPNPTVTIPPIHRDTLRRISEAVDDKWGDAGCVEITHTPEGQEALEGWAKRQPVVSERRGGKYVRVSPEPDTRGQRVFLFFGWASS